MEFVSDHVTHRPPAGTVEGVRIALRSQSLSIEKSRRELGYAPNPIGPLCAKQSHRLWGDLVNSASWSVPTGRRNFKIKQRLTSTGATLRGVRTVAIQADQTLEIIWIVWLMSWVAASFWSDRAQKRAATLETWIYRAAMVAGGILLVPWTGQLLEEKPIWEVSFVGVYVLAAVMFAGLSLTWWARIYLGRLWSSVITRKEDP